MIDDQAAPVIRAFLLLPHLSTISSALTPPRQAAPVTATLAYLPLFRIAPPIPVNSPPLPADGLRAEGLRVARLLPRRRPKGGTMSAQRPLILFVCVNLLASGLQAGPQPSVRPASPAFVDVVLHPTGGVVGRFVDVHGDPIEGAKATLYRGENALEMTSTQSDGTYQFPTAVAGVYRVSIDGQWQMVRVWDAAMRPPAASDWLTIVRQETVVRGERASESLVGQIGLGIGIAGAVGAGIAIAESRDARKETADLRRFLKVSSP
jgi:hypothetical protein